jgi:hypothetical protein
VRERREGAAPGGVHEDAGAGRDDGYDEAQDRIAEHACDHVPVIGVAR